MLYACRLLCFKLTDGKATCKALEFRPIPGAEGDCVAPGAKVLIAGATVKAGIILVDGKSLKVSHPFYFCPKRSTAIFCQEGWQCFLHAKSHHSVI